MPELQDPQTAGPSLPTGPVQASSKPRTLTEAVLAGDRPQAPRTVMQAILDAREPTVGERVQNAMSQVFQGAITDLPASMLATSAVLGHGITQLVTGGKAPLTVEELQTHKWAEAVRDFGKNLVREVPAVHGEKDALWSDKIPRLLGGLAPFWAVAKSVRIAETASVAALGATMSAPQAYDRAKAGGADDVGAWAAFLTGAGTGASMALPVGRIFARWDAASGGALKTVLKDGLLLGAQSGIAAGVGAIVQAQVTHEDIDVLKEAVAEGKTGFMAGLLLGAVTHGRAALIEKRQAEYVRKLTGEQPELTRDLTGKEPPPGEIPPVLRDEAPPEPEQAPPEQVAPPPEAIAPPRAEEAPPPKEIPETSQTEPPVRPPVGIGPVLPRELAGAKPRYSYGAKGFELEFESDVDRALFITSQAKKSKRDADYRSWLRDQGLSDAEIESRGQEIRARIKAEAKDSTAPTITVRASVQPASSESAESAASPRPRVPLTTPVLDAQRTGNGDGSAADATPATFATGTAADPVTGAPTAVRIGPMMTGTLAPPPVPHRGGPVSPVHVISAIQEALRAASSDAVLRVGHVPLRWAQGVFQVWPGIIRMRLANEIGTAAHELAHALEKAVFGWKAGGPWTSRNVTRAIQGELETLGRELYGARQPAGGYKREGWAEFVRYWITQPEIALSKAPELSRWFGDQFLMDHREVGTHLDRARELAYQWRTQGSFERGRAVIVDPSSVAYRYALLKRAHGEFFAARNWLDMALPLEKVDQRMHEILGATGPIRFSAHAQLVALRGLHESTTFQFVHHGPVDLAGNPIPGSMSLVQAAAPARGKRTELMVYMAAKRIKAIAEADTASGSEPREQPISYEDVTYIVETLAKEHPEIALAAENIYAWWEHVNNYAAQASPHYQHWVEATRAFDPGSYVPLQKEMGDVQAAWVRSGRGPARGSGGALIKRLGSSGLSIIDPLTTLVREADARIAKAHREVVLSSLFAMHEGAVRAAMTSPNPGKGIGGIITEIHPDQVKPFRVATERVIAELEKKLGANLPDEIRDAAEGSLTFFMPHYEADPNHMEVARWDRSTRKMRYYELDPDLYKAIEGMDVFRLPAAANFLFRAAALSRNVFRFGTTARASFGLIANPTRDLQTLWLNTQTHHNPITLLAHWSYNMAALAAHHFSGGRITDGSIELFNRLGLEGQSRIGQDFYSASQTSREAFQGWTRYLDPRTPWNFFLRSLQLPESASRLTEVKALARDAGWKPGQPMSFETANFLRRGGKNATTDFTAAGEYARFWNQVIPFFNANIQGPRSNLAAYRRNPMAFMAKGISLSMSTLALWYTQKDKEWYRQMNLRERFNYWHFEFSNNGQRELVRVPRAFFEGAVFAGTVEALADAAYTRDPSKTLDAAGHLLEAVTPNFLPPAADEAVAQLQNRDRFTGVPLVPARERDASMERVAPAEQFDEHTSRMAIRIGQLFNVSPRRIDHAISGLFGRGAEDLVNVLGIGPPENERQFEPADLPILGHSIQRGGALGTNPQAVQHLYDMLERATQIHNSRTTVETAEQRRIRLRLENAAQAVSAAAYVRLHTNETAKRRALGEMANAVAKEAVSGALGLSTDRSARPLAGQLIGQRKAIEAGDRRARLQAAEVLK